MNLNFQQHIPADFNDNSRIWIYQSNRAFTIDESINIEEVLDAFTVTWKSHGESVKGYGNLFFGHFIILMADETASGISGCSTDSSVRLIKSIEQDFSVQMFERLNLAFIVKERIQLMLLTDLQNAIERKVIHKESLYFNNNILSKKELMNNWIIPVKDSWLSTKFKETF